MTEPTSTTVRRRRHGASLKAQILPECERPGASIAAVAMAHGVNANLVHKWRARAVKRQDTAVTAPDVSFVPVPYRLPATAGGKIRQKRVSPFGSLSISTLPRWSVIIALTIDNPNPAPPESRARENSVR